MLKQQHIYFSNNSNISYKYQISSPVCFQQSQSYNRNLNQNHYYSQYYPYQNNQCIKQYLQRPSNQSNIINYNYLSTNENILGSIRIKYLIAYFMICAWISPIYTYHMAVSQGQEKPFPHATITSTACHYPQATLFRFLNLQAGSFLTLIYWLIYRWITFQKKRIGYPHKTQPWLLYLSEISLIGFFIAVGTIDIKGTGKYHGPGAVFFFIVLYIAVVNYTITLRKMRNWNTTVIKRSSMILKQITCGYVSCITAYFIYGIIFDSYQLTNSDKYVVVMEWNLVLICQLWVLSFYIDWKNHKIVLLKNGEVSMIQN